METTASMLCPGELETKGPSILIDRIIEYAMSLSEEDFMEAKAIETMLLKLCGRNCPDEQYHRICGISSFVKHKVTNIYNFYNGSQNIEKINNKDK